MSARRHKLFIGGLSPRVIKSDLFRELSKFGPIAELWIARNPPGFAFVQFEKLSDAEKAVRVLDGANLFDSKLRVEFSRNRPNDGQRSRPVDESRPFFEPRNDRALQRRHNVSPPRRRRSPSPDIYPGEKLRYPYDQLTSFYNSSVLNAAASAVEFPHQVPGNPSMFPHMPPTDDFTRGLKHSRRMSFRRSPSYHRRSRSPVESRSRSPYRNREDYRDRGRRRPSPVTSRRWISPSPLPASSSSFYGPPSLPVHNSEYGSRRHRHYDRSPPPLPSHRMMGRQRR